MIAVNQRRDTVIEPKFCFVACDSSFACHIHSGLRIVCGVAGWVVRAHFHLKCKERCAANSCC